jgi:hypothetical protein
LVADDLVVKGEQCVEVPGPVDRRPLQVLRTGGARDDLDRETLAQPVDATAMVVVLVARSTPLLVSSSSIPGCAMGSTIRASDSSTSTYVRESMGAKA